MKNVVILNFSGRKHGNCSSISEYIKHFYNRTNVQVFRIADHFSPCGLCDYECLRKDARCPIENDDTRKIMEQIRRSNVAYFVIPNYCGAPSANYYAFNERSVGWFDGDRSSMERYMSTKKRFVIVSNSRSCVFEEAMRQQTNEIPDALYLETGKYGKRSIDGDLMESDDAKQALETFLGSYQL